MSLTVNSVPANIDRTAVINVTTSLVEDSTHVNLRVRADVYHEGIVKATVEKPKGLADFDFANILKALTPGLRALSARDSGNVMDVGSKGANLITAWSNYTGTFTLSSTAEKINQAQENDVESSFAKTNDINFEAGSLYCLYVQDYASVGAQAPYFSFPVTAFSQQQTEYFSNGKSIILMATATATAFIAVGRYNGQFDFTGIFVLYKITTDRATVGNPLAPYFIIFTEVYENSSGVTTTGATSVTKVFRYVPAFGDGTAFTEYVLHDSACLFANKTLRNNVTKFEINNPSEYWLCFFTEYVLLHIYVNRDGAGWITYPSPSTSLWECAEGWGFLLLNVGELMSTITTTLGIRMYQDVTSPTIISEDILIRAENIQIDERVVLEFEGLTGGKEYLSFEGVKDIGFSTFRNYRQSSKKMRKPVSLVGLNKQKIETRFKDIANAEYLKSLLISEDVKKLEAAYAIPTPVTITTDEVRISNSDMFTNRLDMEYEY